MEQAGVWGNNFAETTVKSGIPGDLSTKTLTGLMFDATHLTQNFFLIDESEFSKKNFSNKAGNAVQKL